MKELSTLSLDQLKEIKAELSKALKNKKAAKKRASKSPVRLGTLKGGDPAVLVQPEGRVGAPTKLSREALAVLFREDYRSELERFARGEDVDADVFTPSVSEDESSEEE